jgi:hypothetical protein
MFKTLFEAVKVYIAGIMAVVGIVTLIWSMGGKAERKDSEKLGMKKDLTEIKAEQTKQSTRIDSILNIVIDVKEKQSNLLENQNSLLVHQNSLRSSWVTWLVNQKTLTKEDFVKYMNGIEFQITPIDAAENKKKPEFKISIQKEEKEKN